MRVWTREELLDLNVDTAKLDTDIERVLGLCRAALAGYHPAVQAAALADMVAMWVAGHPEEVRDALFKQWADGVRMLVSVKMETAL
jgi:hypothetical protein